MLDLASLTKFNKLLADPVSDHLFGPARTEAAKAESAKKEYLSIIDKYDAKRRHVGYTLSQSWLQEQVQACAIKQFQYIPAAQAVSGYFKSTDTDTSTAFDLKKYYELLEQEINDKDGFLKRKKIEIALADYIETKCAPLSPELNLVKLAEKLRNCRTAGNHGIRFGDDWCRREVMWDAKCGQSKLCPFESRAEGQRLAEKYLPVCESYLRKGYQAHYAVLSRTNVADGQLASEKRELFELTGEIMTQAKYLYDANKAKMERRRRGGENDEEYAARMQQEITAKSIKGMLVVQEDPRSAAKNWVQHGEGEWHPHQNVVFLTKGTFSYTDLRKWINKEFGLHVHIQNIERNDFVSAFLELCKYQVAAVVEKSHDYKHKHAPGMLAWPPEAWIEWFKANIGFRRTRSYGILFDLEDAEDEGGAGAEESEFVKLGRLAYDRAAGVFAIGAAGDNAIFLKQGDKSRSQLFSNRVQEDFLDYLKNKSQRTARSDKSPTPKIKKK